MNCIGCGHVLERDNYVKCNACHSCYCFSCLNIDTKITTDPSKLLSLKCPSCMNTNPSRRRRGNNSPLELNQGFSLTLTPTKSTTTDNMSHTEPPQLSFSLADISALLDQKLAPDSNNMRSLRTALYEDVKSLVSTELNSAIQSLKDDFSKTTDFIMAEVVELKKEIQDKDQLISSLTHEHVRLEKETLVLRSRLNILEKISRGNNIEIQAVPEVNNEDVNMIVASICKSLHVQTSEADIQSCRRVAKMDPKSSRPRNILVTLSSLRLRDIMLSAYTRFNKANPNDKLNSRHANIQGESRRIYLCEHLSAESKQLHSAVRKFAKENNCEFVWIKFGQIYIRKNVTSKAIRITDINFLKNLKFN